MYETIAFTGYIICFSYLTLPYLNSCVRATASEYLEIQFSIVVQLKKGGFYVFKPITQRAHIQGVYRKKKYFFINAVIPPLVV
jgi:hypothetical protein